MSMLWIEALASSVREDDSNHDRKRGSKFRRKSPISRLNWLVSIGSRSQAARDLDRTREEVRRARKIASLSPPARPEAASSRARRRSREFFGPVALVPFQRRPSRVPIDCLSPPLLPRPPETGATCTSLFSCDFKMLFFCSISRQRQKRQRRKPGSTTAHARAGKARSRRGTYRTRRYHQRSAPGP
jgi:hypothetical protein